MNRWWAGGGRAVTVSKQHRRGGDEAGERLLRDFLQRCGRQYQGSEQVLIVMGHGGGLVAPGDEVTGGLGAEAVARVLRQATELGKPLSVISLDSCYGASLEALFELRNLTHYVIASPTEVVSPGLAWGSRQRELQRGETVAVGDLVRGLVEQGMAESEADLGPVGLVGLQLGAVDEVVAATGELARALTTDLDNWRGAVTLVRGRCRSYGAAKELCDVGQLAAGLGRQVTDGPVPVAAARLAESLGELVVAEWWRGGEATDYPVSSIGIYFPATVEQLSTTYNKRYTFSRESGWGAFLSRYWDQMWDSLRGQAG